MIRHAKPCTPFAGIFTSDGAKPYIKPSNRDTYKCYYC